MQTAWEILIECKFFKTLKKSVELTFRQFFIIKHLNYFYIIQQLIINVEKGALWWYDVREWDESQTRISVRMKED